MPSVGWPKWSANARPANSGTNTCHTVCQTRTFPGAAGGVDSQKEGNKRGASHYWKRLFRETLFHFPNGVIVQVRRTCQRAEPSRLQKSIPGALTGGSDGPSYHVCASLRAP